MRKRFLILTGTLILIMSKNVWAEDEKSSKRDFIALEPITITASRRERKVSEVASSVSIVTENQIEYSDAKSVPGLLKDLESTYMYDASGVGTASRVNMRGFWGGMSTHHLVLIDGIPQNKGGDKLVEWDLIPLYNIKSVEIVRGPASALYGDNAMSGVINIITEKPGTTPALKISGSYGNFNTQNYYASISGPLKKVGCYFGISRKSTDGFRVHCNYENIILNGKLDFPIDETQTLKLTCDYYDKRTGAHPWAVNEVQLEEDRRRARPGTENDETKTKKVDASLIYHKEIGEIATLEGTFYYRYENDEGFYTGGSTERSTEKQFENESTYGLPLQFCINPEVFGIKNSFTTGIDLELNDLDYKEYEAPFHVKGSILSYYGVMRYKVGPYIQDEISLIDQLKIILGLRYDSVRFNFGDQIDNSNSNVKTMSKFTPKCGLVYHYKENSKIYTSFSQAFRTPTIGQMFAYGTFSNPNLNAEEATNYEIGINHQFNDYLKGNVSLYWMELDKEIWYDAAERIYKNYGKTSHRGIETGVDFKIVKGLSGFANYNYTRAQNGSGNDKGKYLTHIPIHKWGAGIKIETDFGLKVNLMSTTIGNSYIDSANDDKLGSYTTIDGKIIYGYKWVSVFLAIDNLLNKKYNSYGYKGSRSIKYFNSAPGRTFTFGLDVKF